MNHVTCGNTIYNQLQTMFPDTSTDDQISPRSDIVVGFGTVASTVVLGAGNIVSLLIGFLFRKKVEVLVILVAVLAPALYLKGYYDPAQVDSASLETAISNNDIGGVIDSLGVVVPAHNSSQSEEHNKEGRFVGSLFSSLVNALVWPLQSIFLWPVQFISSLFGYESVPLISSNTTTTEGDNDMPHHEYKKGIETLEELQEIINEAVRQHMGQYEEEIQRIKFTLYDHSVNIDSALVASIDAKYGEGAWSNGLASIIKSSALVKRSAPETFKLELSSVVGDLVTQVMNIKTDTWSSVKQVRSKK